MNKNILLFTGFILLMSAFIYVNYPKQTYLRNSLNSQPSTTTVISDPEVTHTPSAVTGTTSKTNTWQKYTNQTFGYEISYPSTYKVAAETDQILSLTADNGNTVVLEISEPNPKDASGNIITDIDQSYMFVTNEEYLNIQGIRALKDWHTNNPTNKYPEGAQKVTTLRFIKDSRLWMITAIIHVEDTQGDTDAQKILSSVAFTK